MYTELQKITFFQGQMGFDGKRGEAGAPGLPVSVPFISLGNVNSYSYCVGLSKHTQCNSNQTVLIILGRSWAKGTTRAERIQRWSSKDVNNSIRKLRVYHLSWNQVTTVQHELFMLQGQKGKPGATGPTGTKGPPVSWRLFLSIFIWSQKPGGKILVTI